MAQSKTENLSSNNLTIILLLVSLLVVGVSGLVAKSLYSSIVRDHKVVEAKEAADKQLAENVKNAPRLVEAYAGLGTQTRVLADALPTKEDFPSLIVTLENMSFDSGVKLKSVSPSQIGTDAATEEEEAVDSSVALPKVYQFSVSIDGNFVAIQKFLTDLEMSARPMRVVDMQLNGTNTSLAAELQIQTYYQDQAQLPISKETIK